ncbi:MAG: transketolase C-terminal domain-containing protein, partial [Lacisediminimonas sp.]|nr:transketolase C-terminal domain-containing protein [Lacisediminimonas sp.]
VIRMATGAGRQLAAQHSHSLEGWYAHIPGIRVLAPATVADARGMLGPALADPDPVIIFEHVQLYNSEDELPDSPDSWQCDIERAAVRRSGQDLCMIAYGGGVSKALAAAQELAAIGIDAEVIDLRVLRPLDTDTIVSAVCKTHRVIVIDEAWKSGSLSAEICARVIEHAFYELDAPPLRVCGAEVPIPYARQQEQAALPQVPDIVRAAMQLMGRA